MVANMEEKPYFEKCLTNTFVLLAFFFIVITLSISVMLSARDFKKYKIERQEERSGDELYILKNCNDDSEMKIMNVIDECHMRKHRIEQDLNDLAVYDVLEDWYFCGSDGCLSALTKKAPHVAIFEIVISIVILTVFIILMFLLCVFSSCLKDASRSVLPFTKKIN